MKRTAKVKRSRQNASASVLLDHYVETQANQAFHRFRRGGYSLLVGQNFLRDSNSHVSFFV